MDKLMDYKNNAESLNDDDIILEDEGETTTFANKPKVEEKPEEEKEYDGPGAVITKEQYDRMKESQNTKGFKVGKENTEETKESVKAYMEDMDKQIEEAKETHDKIKASEEYKASKTNKLETVTVIIDKDAASLLTK